MFPESDARTSPYHLYATRTPSSSHIPEDFRQPWMPWPSQIPKFRIFYSESNWQTSEQTSVSEPSASTPRAKPRQKTTPGKYMQKGRRSRKTLVYNTTPPAEPLGMSSSDISTLSSLQSSPLRSIPSISSAASFSTPLMFLAAVCEAVATPQHQSNILHQKKGEEERTCTLAQPPSPSSCLASSSPYDTKPREYDVAHEVPVTSSPSRASPQHRLPQKTRKDAPQLSLHETAASASSTARTSVSASADGSSSGSKRRREEEDIPLRVSKRRRMPTERAQAQSVLLPRKPPGAGRPAARSRKTIASSCVPSSPASGISSTTTDTQRGKRDRGVDGDDIDVDSPTACLGMSARTRKRRKM